VIFILLAIAGVLGVSALVKSRETAEASASTPANPAFQSPARTDQYPTSQDVRAHSNLILAGQGAPFVYNPVFSKTAAAPGGIGAGASGGSAPGGTGGGGGGVSGGGGRIVITP
jgi:uncharacterized membrane protein YgcG